MDHGDEFLSAKKHKKHKKDRDRDRHEGTIFFLSCMISTILSKWF